MSAIAKLKLNARVLHVAHVAVGLRFAHIAWDRHLYDHAVGLLYVVVGSECEGAVEECEVKTYVGLFALLPLEVGVGKAVSLRADSQIGICAEVVVATHRGECGVEEVADIVVTVLTPAHAQLHVA